MSERVVSGPQVHADVPDSHVGVAMEARARDQAALVRFGAMVATVAHELQNPIAGVRAAVQVIGMRLPAGSREAEIVPEILARLDGLNGLVVELLLVARPPRPEKAAVDITALVTRTAALLKEDPSLEGMQIDIAGGRVTAMADAPLMDGVFRNLLLNSAQAVHGRGRIQVSVEALPHACRIAIADDGPGIPLDVRDRIFRPFFTTKPRGTGLGLSTAKRFVEAHDGTISVDLPPHGGTIVTVHLPLEG